MAAPGPTWFPLSPFLHPPFPAVRGAHSRQTGKCAVLVKLPVFCGLDFRWAGAGGQTRRVRPAAPAGGAAGVVAIVGWNLANVVWSLAGYPAAIGIFGLAFAAPAVLGLRALEFAGCHSTRLTHRIWTPNIFRHFDSRDLRRGAVSTPRSKTGK